MTTETPNPISTACIVAERVDPREYHKRDKQRGDPAFVMSRGELCTFAACPAKWKAGVETESNGATEWGDLADCRLLTPEQEAIRFAICPETYPATPKRKDDPIEQKPWTRTANYCKEWEATQVFNGKTPIKADVSAEAWLAHSKFDESIKSLIAASRVQVHVEGEYQDEDTGLVIPLRGLIDLVPPVDHDFLGKALVDLKTTNNAAPRVWARHINDYGLDFQAALYLDLYTAATQEDRNTFCHIVQENKPPYHVELMLLGQETAECPGFVDLGRQRYTDALKLYCQCLRTNEWPSYPWRNRIAGWCVVSPEAFMLK